jgi:hypothetical protein
MSRKLGHWQVSSGIPLPASTTWTASRRQPVKVAEMCGAEAGAAVCVEIGAARRKEHAKKARMRFMLSWMQVV